jgi:dGTPase
MPKACAEYSWYGERETARANIAEPVQSASDRRSPFERDWARIIHSVAFRRLQGKTQIFAPATADYLRTRVTHSIEVAQIGRGMADRFGVPTALVEAACLGHDLGHPPFGHTGEQALDLCMEDHGGYEGNAQSFHIVTKLEQKHPDYDGLDLARETLLALVKYPYRKSADRGKYLYEEDAQVYEGWLYDGSAQRLLTDATQSEPRTIACQLMDWSDDIAYSVHDLEDGIVTGYLQPATWQTDGFLEILHRSVHSAPIKWQEGPPTQEEIAAYVKPLYDRLATGAPEVPMDVLRETTRHYIDKFVGAVDIRVDDDVTTSFDFRLDIPEEIRVENQVLKSITFEYILRDPRTVQIFHKGEKIVGRLYKELYANAMAKQRKDRFLLFPRWLRGELEVDRDNASALARIVADYIASLTEGQAVRLYSRLFEPFSHAAGDSAP